MADADIDVNSIVKKLMDEIKNISKDNTITDEEKTNLFKKFSKTHTVDLVNLKNKDINKLNGIQTQVQKYMRAHKVKMDEVNNAIEQKKEIDIPVEYIDLNLDKDQLKNKQYINEQVPKLLRTDHRVGYIMLCIYSKLKSGISEHIKDIIENLKNDQNSDFSYPPFYLDYPNNNVNVNSLNDLFVYTHIGLYYYGKLYPGEQNIQIFNNVLDRVLTHDIVDYSDKSFVTDNLKTLQFSNDATQLKFQQIFTNICCCILSPGIKNNIVIHSELRSLVTLMIYYIGLNYNAIKIKLERDWEKLYLYYLCQQDDINAFINSNFANAPTKYDSYKPNDTLQLLLLPNPLQNDINNNVIQKVLNNSYAYQPFNCKAKDKKIDEIGTDLIPDADRAEVGKYLTPEMINMYVDAKNYQPNKNGSDNFTTILNSASNSIKNLISMLNSNDFRFKDYRKYLIAYIDLYHNYHQKYKNYKKMLKLNLKNNVAMNISANELRTKNVSTELNKLDINNQCGNIGDNISPIKTEIKTKIGTEDETNEFKTYKHEDIQKFVNDDVEPSNKTLLVYSTMLSILFKIPYLLPEYLGKLYSKTKFSKATINRIVDYISKINKHDNVGEIAYDNKDLPSTFEKKRDFFERVLKHYDIEFAFKNSFANNNIDKAEYSMHSRFEIFDQIVNSDDQLLCIDDFNYISEYIFKATFCDKLEDDCSSYAIAASKKILSEYVNDDKIGDIGGKDLTKNVTQTDLNEVNNYIQTVYKPKFVNIRGSTEVDDTEITPTLAQDIIEETDTVTYVLFYMNDQHKQFDTKFEDYKFITELETMKLFNDIVKPDKLYKGLANTIKGHDQFDQDYKPDNDNKKAILTDFITFSGLDPTTAKISAAGNFKFSLLKLLFIIFIVLIVIIVIIKFAPKIKNFIKKHL